jgi:hypothetical protein
MPTHAHILRQHEVFALSVPSHSLDYRIDVRNSGGKRQLRMNTIMNLRVPYNADF